MINLRNISTKEETNRFLREYYIPRHNKAFARQALYPRNLHQPVSNNKLYHAFVTTDVRTVRND